MNLLQATLFLGTMDLVVFFTFAVLGGAVMTWVDTSVLAITCGSIYVLEGMTSIEERTGFKWAPSVLEEKTAARMAANGMGIRFKRFFGKLGYTKNGK